MFQAVQIAGSLLILSAFVAAQAGRLEPASYRYLIANAAGSAILTATAIAAVEWGFILLEGVWALVSLWSISRKLSTRRAATSPLEIPSVDSTITTAAPSQPSDSRNPACSSSQAAASISPSTGP